MAHQSRRFPELLRESKLLESVDDDTGGTHQIDFQDQTFKTSAMISGMRKAEFAIFLDMKKAGLNAMSNIRIKENVVIFEKQKV